MDIMEKKMEKDKNDMNKKMDQDRLDMEDKRELDKGVAAGLRRQDHFLAISNTVIASLALLMPVLPTLESYIRK
jgi:hypothetical protein